MPYEPIVPDGQHLGTSHQVDGAVTGHLFDDAGNKLQGHAAWREVPEPDVDYTSTYEDEPPRRPTQEELELAAKIAAMIVIFVAEVVVAVKLTSSAGGARRRSRRPGPHGSASPQDARPTELPPLPWLPQCSLKARPSS